MYRKRELEELLDSHDPAWPLVQSWIANSENDVSVLQADPESREEALLSCQITTHSPLGAIIYETGGILVDNGWIRVLGCGCARVPRPIHSWNLGRSVKETGAAQPGFFLVADDPLGGFFALNGGALGEDIGRTYYHAPDTLEWEPLSMGYSAFVQWLFTPNLAEWSDSFRWPGWENEVRNLRGDKGILITPPLTAAGPPIVERHRGEVPVAELYTLFVDSNAPT